MACKAIKQRKCRTENFGARISTNRNSRPGRNTPLRVRSFEYVCTVSLGFLRVRNRITMTNTFDATSDVLDGVEKAFGARGRGGQLETECEIRLATDARKVPAKVLLVGGR